MIKFDDDPNPDDSRRHFETPSLLAYTKSSGGHSDNTTPKGLRILYGHKVSNLSPNIASIELPTISMFKLLLDDSGHPHVADTKEEVRSQLQNLKELGFVEDDTDVIRDFLQCILRCSKRRLELDGDYNDGDTCASILLEVDYS